MWMSTCVDETRGRILGRNWDKSLKRFPPGYIFTVTSTNSKFIRYIPVRQVMYILNNSPINCVVQWLEGKINILFYSILF